MQAIDYIKKIYPEHPKPLYLSNLGGILKKNNFQISNLREFVESINGFTVVCGPEKERTAIATIDDQQEIETLLNKKADNIDKESFQFLSKLPRTLLFAFASKRKAQPNVYFMVTPPYSFGFVKENDSMVEIQSDLLLDAKIPINLKHLELDIASKLSTSIKKWIDDNSIDLPAFAKNTPKRLAGNQVTLLEEMINSIPANKRSKVVLPLDIISCLIKKR
jgi:hypothetical protein